MDKTAKRFVIGRVLLGIALLVLGAWVLAGCTDPDGQFTLHQPVAGAPSRDTWQEDCVICTNGHCELTPRQKAVAKARHPDWDWIKVPATQPDDSNAFKWRINPEESN